MPVYTSRYSKEKTNSIRFNILMALDELAKFNGIDINTIKNTPPYSSELRGVTSQKIAAELKKLIDSGMVVKGIVRGKTVKYMLRDTYNNLKISGEEIEDFGYGDYRDNQPKVEYEEEESNIVCERIRLSATRNKYEEMW